MPSLGIGIPTWDVFLEWTFLDLAVNRWNCNYYKDLIMAFFFFFSPYEGFSLCEKYRAAKIYLAII